MFDTARALWVFMIIFELEDPLMSSPTGENDIRDQSCFGAGQKLLRYFTEH